MFFYLYIKTRLNILNLIQPIGYAKQIEGFMTRIISKVSAFTIMQYVKATSKNCFASDLWNFLEKISTFF